MGCSLNGGVYPMRLRQHHQLQLQRAHYKQKIDVTIRKITQCERALNFTSSEHKQILPVVETCSLSITGVR